MGSTKNKYRGRFNSYKSVQRNVREKVLGEKSKETKRGRPKNEEKEKDVRPFYKNKNKNKTDFEKKCAQEKFHEHFCKEGHKGIEDWEVILIDSANSEKSLRSKELFWQYKLETFYPDGLNEIEAIVDIT